MKSILEELASMMKKSKIPENPNKNMDFDKTKLKEIYLAGGCFWGVEAYIARIPGVYDTVSGYANGNKDNPSYEEVCSGTTDFVEAVHVLYDPDKVKLETILEYFFRVVDPTSMNKQGNDVGTQYRSGLYYKDKDDRIVIDNFIIELQEKYQSKIVTEVLPLENFFLAEEYHQDYLEKNPTGYCHIDFSKLK